MLFTQQQRKFAALLNFCLITETPGLIVIASLCLSEIARDWTEIVISQHDHSRSHLISRKAGVAVAVSVCLQRVCPDWSCQLVVVRGYVLYLLGAVDLCSDHGHGAPERFYEHTSRTTHQLGSSPTAAQLYSTQLSGRTSQGVTRHQTRQLAVSVLVNYKVSQWTSGT